MSFVPELLLLSKTPGEHRRREKPPVAPARSWAPPLVARGLRRSSS